MTKLAAQSSGKPTFWQRHFTDVVTTALMPPMLLAALYLVSLNVWHRDMLGQQLLGVDPFKQIWWGPPTAATVLYIVGVNAGLRAMEGRQAFELKQYMFTYNLYQVVLNIWCVVGFVKEVAGFGYAKGMTFWGNYADRSASGFFLGFLVWVHYNNKYVELLDTAFMILRKKRQQISYLHMYHHVLMIWAWFLVCKVEAGGDTYFGASVNSFVHIVMYTYYLLSMCKVPCPWKRYLTQVQLLQFCLCLTHSAYVVWKGNSPLVLPLAQAFVMINMLVLFLNFYAKTYKKGAAQEKAQKVA